MQKMSKFAFPLAPPLIALSRIQVWRILMAHLLKSVYDILTTI